MMTSYTVVSMSNQSTISDLFVCDVLQQVSDLFSGEEESAGELTQKLCSVECQKETTI